MASHVDHESSADGAEPSTGGFSSSDAHWPTWDDIARMHPAPRTDSTAAVREPAHRLRHEPEPGAETPSVSQPEPAVAPEPAVGPSSVPVAETPSVASEPVAEPPATAPETVAEPASLSEQVPVAEMPSAASEPVAEPEPAPEPEPAAEAPLVEPAALVEPASVPVPVAEPPATAPEAPLAAEPVSTPAPATGTVPAAPAVPVAPEPVAVVAPAVAPEPPDHSLRDDDIAAQPVEPQPVEPPLVTPDGPEPDVPEPVAPEPDGPAAVLVSAPVVRPAAMPPSIPPTSLAATRVMSPVPPEEPVTADTTVVLAPVAGEASRVAPVPRRTSALTPPPPPPAPAPARVRAFPATSTPATASPRVSAGAIPAAQPTREPSVLDVFDEQEDRRRWPLRLAVVLGVLVVLAGAYVGACAALRDKVPRGATVAGVDIGGLRSSDAIALLNSQLADATGKPLTLVAHGVQAQLDPTTAGLTFNPTATVDSVTGFAPTDPGRLWRQVIGLGEVTPVTSVDSGALTKAVAGLSTTLNADPVDGAIVFVDGAPRATPAKEGWTVDQAAAVRQIAATWLVAARPLTLPTTAVQPAITQAATERELSDVAEHVSGGPVAVTIGGTSVTLTGPTLAKNASFVAKNGSLVLQMDGKALVDAIVAQQPDALTSPQDAHFTIQSAPNSPPVLVPEQDGTSLDPDAVATAIAAAASKATDRTATLQFTSTPPATTTDALDALGIKEVVSEFDTPLTSDHVRDVNITLGAKNITGTLIKPGETFSLSQALGPIDAAHGFISAGAVVSGRDTDAIGGGLSQISTTTLNAAYFAGFDIVAHTPHSNWYQRYPEGRESTIFTPTIDMKWKNNSPYGALVQAWVANNRVYVQIWSTKYWTVTSTTSARSNVHQPTTIYDTSKGCTGQSMGNPGFTVTVKRWVFLGSTQPATPTNTWTTTYQPQNAIICGAKPAAAPSPSPSP